MSSMRARLFTLFAVCLGSTAMFFSAEGCGSSGAGADAGLDGSTEGGAGEICTATFRWLQKDAYKSTPGRNSALWPPHTTTTLSVECGGADGGYAFHDNHGTAPTATDDAGTPCSSAPSGPRSPTMASPACWPTRTST